MTALMIVRKVGFEVAIESRFSVYQSRILLPFSVLENDVHGVVFLLGWDSESDNEQHHRLRPGVFASLPYEIVATQVKLGYDWKICKALGGGRRLGVS